MSNDKIIGHKTFLDENGEYYHEPLFSNEAEEIFAKIEANKKRCADLMPDEESAIRMMFDAAQRLKEFGWRDAVYCPKNGTLFNVLEINSTGIHKATYEGEWPKGGFWVHDRGDMFPSRPALYRDIKSDI